MDIVPIKNEKRQVVLFLVSHKDISREKAVSTPESRLTDINGRTLFNARKVMYVLNVKLLDISRL